MSRDEIKAAISERLGLELRDRTEHEVEVLSPKGEPLFMVSLYGRGGCWHFGGHGELLRSAWGDFCNLGYRGTEGGDHG